MSGRGQSSVEVLKELTMHSSITAHFTLAEHQPQSKPLPRHEEQLGASPLQLYRIPARNILSLSTHLEDWALQLTHDVICGVSIETISDSVVGPDQLQSHCLF